MKKQAGEVAGAIHGWQAVVTLKRGQAPTGGEGESVSSKQRTGHCLCSGGWLRTGGVNGGG